MSIYKNKKLINKLTDEILDMESLDWEEGVIKNRMKRLKPSSQKIKGLYSQNTSYYNLKEDDREYMVVFGFPYGNEMSNSDKWDMIGKEFPFLIEKTEEDGLQMKKKEYTFGDTEVLLQIWNEHTNKGLECYGVLCSFDVYRS